jgi:hypothetical protein
LDGIVRMTQEPSKAPLYLRFVGALFTGNAVKVPQPPAEIKSFEGWTPEQLEVVVETAKGELDRQTVNLDRVLGRSQALFTTILALSGLWLTVAPTRLEFVWQSARIAETTLLLLAAALYLVALAGSVALIATRKQYGAISVLELAKWNAFDLLKLAHDYEWIVPIGREVTNHHITVFGTAVKYTVAASIAFGIARLLQIG